MTFRVGQKVVCVDNGFTEEGDYWCEMEAPQLGEVYTVMRTFIDDEGDEILHLLEICRAEKSRQHWGDDIGYAAFRFRPIVERKTSIEVFTRMLTDQKVDA